MEPAHYLSSPLAVDWAERATARYRCQILHVLENETFRDVVVRSGTTAYFPKQMRLKITPSRSSEENSPVMMRDSRTCAAVPRAAGRSPCAHARTGTRGGHRASEALGRIWERTRERFQLPAVAQS
jgi:hypothetical protein